MDQFDASVGLVRGRPLWFEALWYAVKCLFLLSPWPWPSSMKVLLLRRFGARIGQGCYIKPRVNIHLPWKLTIGDHVWIGEEAFILNFEPVTIGSHCCLSQRSFLCTGNHDFRDPSMPYRNRPISIEDGAWVGAGAFVGPGVTVGSDAVICAGSVVTNDLEAGKICSGNPCKPVKDRWPYPKAATSGSA